MNYFALHSELLYLRVYQRDNLPLIHNTWGRVWYVKSDCSIFKINRLAVLVLMPTVMLIRNILQQVSTKMLMIPAQLQGQNIIIIKIL